MKQSLGWVLGICLVFWTAAPSAAQSHLYSIWDTLELDGCASAWLIQRFIDPQAQFKFYPKGELIVEGTAFDTPEAEFRRTQNASTFESLLAKYKIRDETLITIGRMIHDVEINFWTLAPDSPVVELNKKIAGLKDELGSVQAALERGFTLMDELYQSLR